MHKTLTNRHACPGVKKGMHTVLHGDVIYIHQIMTSIQTLRNFLVQIDQYHVCTYFVNPKEPYIDHAITYPLVVVLLV